MDSAANRRTLFVNAATNALALLAQLAVAFILAPPMLRYFGRERYGVWSFIESLLAYFTLLDLGVAATLVRYVPKFRTEGDPGKLNRLISACLLVFSGAGLVALVAGMGLIWLVLQYSSKIPLELRGEVCGMAVASLVALALSLPLSVFPAILDGLGRFALKSGLRTLFLSLRVTGVVGVLWMGGDLIALAIVYGCMTLGEMLAMGLAVRRLLPDVAPAPWRTDRETLRLVRGYSVDAFLAMLAGRIAFKTDAIVIGLCGSMGLIPFFDMPARLVEYAKNLIRSATTTLTPAFSSLDARGSRDAIRELFLTGCRYALYLALPIQVGLIMFGGTFLELWLGDPEYRERGQPILWILAGTLSVGMMQSVAARVLYGVGQIRLFARLMLLEAALNLGLSLALYPSMGINGVALGTAIPNVAMCLYIVIHVCRLLEVDDRLMFQRSLLRPLAAAVALTALWCGLRLVVPPTSRLNFAQLICLGTAAYAGLCLLIELGPGRLVSLLGKAVRR